MNPFDLVVVGTSFSSSFFLKKYLEKAPANKKVLVLERGYLFTHADRVREKAGTGPKVSNPNQARHESIINKTPEKNWVFQTGFGGSSNCWYACTPRFMPNDFHMKSRYGIGEDWPVTYDDLEPYYVEAERIMDVSGPEITPFPRSQPYPQPPHFFTEVDKVLHKTYGPLYINQPTARARLATKGRNACCGTAICGVCPANAKFTIENSGMGVYEDPRVTLIQGATVTHLLMENKLVKKLFFLRDGKEESVEAEVFVLGANAIFNANILLNSGDSHPKTGRGLGEQLGLQADVYLRDFKNVGGSTWVTANGYMLYDGEHRKNYAACLIESSNYPYVRIEKGKWRNIASFRMIFEDLPQDSNQVKVSEDRIIPQVNFNGASDYTKRAVANMKAQLPKLLAALPVEDIRFNNPYSSEAHILGTTRMSNDPLLGVVDANCIHHNYRNLFVLGSGSFPTFTPSNPTLTISALSLFVADKNF